MSWSFLDLTGLSRFFGKLPEKLVTTETTQIISGTKSFSSTIIGSVSGSAASASKDGSGNIIADTYETKADAATHLSKSDAAGTYLSKTDAASTCVQTGAVDQTVAGTKTFSKPIVGSVTGSSGSCTGNAASATKLATARSLWGNNFDGSAAITGAITGTPSIEFKPVATTSNNGGFLDFHYNQSTADYTSRIIESASGTLSINNVTITTGKVVTATTFNGALTGNVTGNCSGSSGSCTGNAATATTAKACTGNAASATKLQTARTINGIAFDGTANITIPVTAPVGVIIPFAGTSVPTGYLLCNGAAVSRTDYANLFAAIGTLYGAGDGSTTFNLPDARDRVLQGASGTHSVGSYISARLPNITGELSAAPRFSDTRLDSVYARTGAFSYADSESWISDLTVESAHSYNWHCIKLDASRSSSIYGNSSTVQPPAIAINFIIKY